jgi:hypothetical protein
LSKEEAMRKTDKDCVEPVRRTRRVQAKRCAPINVIQHTNSSKDKSHTINPTKAEIVMPLTKFNILSS